MEQKAIILPSFWGRDVVQRHFTANRPFLVVQFPGQHYSNDKPLFDYSGKAAQECGHDLLLLEYGYQAARVEFHRDDGPVLVQECLQALKLVKDDYQQLIFVSKSLGTLVAGEIARILSYDRVRHIFLTPIRPALPHMAASGGIAIYGTNDKLFGAVEAAEAGKSGRLKVFPIEGADHGLEVGNIQDSLAIMQRIVMIYHDFFKANRL
jgi:hypothetical protein